jgi:hypothetical protein
MWFDTDMQKRFEPRFAWRYVGFGGLRTAVLIRPTVATTMPLRLGDGMRGE